MPIEMPVVLIIGMSVLITIGAVYALLWAARDGQFQRMQEGANVIFDDEEPIGKPTDVVFQPKPQRRAKLRAANFAK